MKNINRLDTQNEELVSKYPFLAQDICVKFYSTNFTHINPCVCAFERTSPTKYPVGPWKLSKYVIHFVLDGYGSCEYDGKKMTIEPGSIFSIVPNVLVSYKQIPSNPWRSVWIEIIGSECAEIFKKIGLGDSVFIRKVEDFDKFSNLFLNIMNDCNNTSDPNGYIFLSHLYNIFYYIEKEFGTEKNKVRQRNKLIDNIIHYIDNNYNNKISAVTIAKEFYISSQYLAKLFKKELKTTPTNYVTTVRLEKAAFLLSNTSFSIANISDLVGFSNPFYFTNQFKKKYIVSPKRYRNLSNNQNNN